MRRISLIVAAALFSLTACGGVTTPQGGGGDPVGQVTVGNILFRSAHNGSQNPAVDTTGVPPEIFRNSVVMAGAHDTYTVTFRNPGTYTYDCAIHGSAMTGRIVVQ